MNKLGEDFFSLLRLCSFERCVENGDSSLIYGKEKFVTVFNLDIKSFYGDIIKKNDHKCIRNLGISYVPYTSRGLFLKFHDL